MMPRKVTFSTGVDELESCWLKTFALDLQHNLCRFWLFILTLFFLPGILYTHVSVLCCQSTILYNVTSHHLQTQSKLSTFYKFGSPPPQKKNYKTFCATSRLLTCVRVPQGI